MNSISDHELALAMTTNYLKRLDGCRKFSDL
jgi:hypothetical protein